MNRRTIPFSFPNARGEKLSGLIDMPAGEPLFYGVFAPCFTCTKESHGAFKICRALAENGIAMLRFDITGLGGSDGDFSATNFTVRTQDITAACESLEIKPKLLIGHSISGTAALSAAKHLPYLQAIATVGAPRDPTYVIEKFRRNGQIKEKEDGTVEINVMGRPFRFDKNFIPDMLAQTTAEDTAKITQKLFVFHAPHDDIVSYENAEAIAQRSNGELIRLDEAATHLFENRREDAAFVAETLVEWFRVHLA